MSFHPLRHCVGGHPNVRVLIPVARAAVTGQHRPTAYTNSGPSLLTVLETGSPKPGAAQLGSQGRPSAWSQMPPSHCVPTWRRESQPGSPQLLIRVLIPTEPTLTACSKPNPLPKAPPPNTVPRVDRGALPAGTTPSRPVAGLGYSILLAASRKFALRHPKS